MRKRIVPVGKRFGKLTVIEELPGIPRQKNKTRRVIKCKCDCGSTTTAYLENLASGNTSSCGCHRVEVVSLLNRTHGLSGHRLFWIWSHIKDRCLNKLSKHYKYYGANGVSLCNEWLESFAVFYKWAIDSGWKQGLTIERKDPFGNYCPENCTFVPMSQQNRNKRNHRMIEYKGVTRPLFLLCEEAGIDYRLVWLRLKRGWSIDRALSTPI